MIDSHAHLNDPAFKDNLEEVLDRVQQSGIEKIIVPATSIKTSYEVIELASKYEMLYAAVGIHPSDVKDYKEGDIQKLDDLSKDKKVVAIGEIGLDYYWKPYDKELQQKALKLQLELAIKLNLPVILHNRESSEDLLNIITEYQKSGNLKGQFHSFSGDAAMAKACIDMGFYISFTGNITYKPNERTLIAYEIIKQTPLENLLLETDSPYLPPVPYRGKQNQPSYLKYTAEKIAELKGIELKQLEEITTLNVKNLFGI